MAELFDFDKLRALKNFEAEGAEVMGRLFRAKDAVFEGDGKLKGPCPASSPEEAAKRTDAGGGPRAGRVIDVGSISDRDIVVRFGLTSAPATFRSLIRRFLRTCLGTPATSIPFGGRDRAEAEFTHRRLFRLNRQRARRRRRPELALSDVQLLRRLALPPMQSPFCR